MKYQNLTAFEKHLQQAAKVHISRVFLIVSSCPYERKKIVDKILSAIRAEQQERYPNNLKNREFDKAAETREGPVDLRSAKQVKRSEPGPKGALNLSQAKPAEKQHNLNKLCDASGLEGSGCPTQSKTDSSGCLGIDLHVREASQGPIEELIDGLNTASLLSGKQVIYLDGIDKLKK